VAFAFRLPRVAGVPFEAERCSVGVWINVLAGWTTTGTVWHG
jgi:hypothetical protein